MATVVRSGTTCFGYSDRRESGGCNFVWMEMKDGYGDFMEWLDES